MVHRWAAVKTSVSHAVVSTNTHTGHSAHTLHQLLLFPWFSPSVQPSRAESHTEVPRTSWRFSPCHSQTRFFGYDLSLWSFQWLLCLHSSSSFLPSSPKVTYCWTCHTSLHLSMNFRSQKGISATDKPTCKFKIIHLWMILICINSYCTSKTLGNF